MAFRLRQGIWAGAIVVLSAANLAAQAVPSQLGVSEGVAQGSFLESVVSGYPDWGAAGAAFVALPMAARVAVVQGGFAWARAYVKSTGFRTGYESARQRMKPQPPEVEGTVDDELKRQLDAHGVKGVGAGQRQPRSMPAGVVSPSMRSAAWAAPKPLSMLTTASPDAQLASAACSAVRPPSATP